jgi:hypothetical protein
MKTQRSVERPGLVHTRERIQAHTIITQRAGMIDDGLRQISSQTMALKLGHDIQTFHLANLRSETADTYTTHDGVPDFRDHHAPVRRRILAGESLHLAVERLKLQINVERTRIVLDQESNGIILAGKRLVNPWW